MNWAEYQAQNARGAARQRVVNPEKVKARCILNHAIKKGRVIKQPCCRCGAERSEGHHHDYSKPLEVTWLCKSCHATESCKQEQNKQAA